MSDAPRFEARPSGFRDGLGQPDFVVVDTRNDLIHNTWSGYFAGTDARDAARRLNDTEEQDHE